MSGLPNFKAFARIKIIILEGQKCLKMTQYQKEQIQWGVFLCSKKLYFWCTLICTMRSTANSPIPFQDVPLSFVTGFPSKDLKQTYP